PSAPTPSAPHRTVRRRAAAAPAASGRARHTHPVPSPESTATVRRRARCRAWENASRTPYSLTEACARLAVCASWYARCTGDAPAQELQPIGRRSIGDAREVRLLRGFARLPERDDALRAQQREQLQEDFGGHQRVA